MRPSYTLGGAEYTASTPVSWLDSIWSMEHSLGNQKLSGFYRDRGFAGRVGFGERPALLVIDLARAWTDPASPLGSDLAAVVDNTVPLLARARHAGLPMYFTT